MFRRLWGENNGVLPTHFGCEAIAPMESAPTECIGNVRQYGAGVRRFVNDIKL